MMGSASFKSVLPAFAPDLSYEDLEISDGNTASMMYLSCVKSVVSDADKENIYRSLRKYCKMDTLAEARLLDVLYEHVD
jgi:hypothetical protein